MSRVPQQWSDVRRCWPDCGRQMCASVELYSWHRKTDREDEVSRREFHRTLRCSGRTCRRWTDTQLRDRSRNAASCAHCTFHVTSLHSVVTWWRLAVRTPNPALDRREFYTRIHTHTRHVHLHSLGVACMPRWTACCGTLESSFLFVRGVQADNCLVDLVLCLGGLILYYEAVFHFWMLC